MEEALTINLIAIETATTTKTILFQLSHFFFKKDPKLLKPEVKESPSFRKISKPRFKKTRLIFPSATWKLSSAFFRCCKNASNLFFPVIFLASLFSTWLWGSRSMVEIFQHSRLLGSILPASSSSVSLSLSLSLTHTHTHTLTRTHAHAHTHTRTHSPASSQFRSAAMKPNHFCQRADEKKWHKNWISVFSCFRKVGFFLVGGIIAQWLAYLRPDPAAPGSIPRIGPCWG